MTSGRWELATLSPGEIAAARDIVRRYLHERIGLTDASNLVLADRYRTSTIATLDRRHFGVLTLAGGAGVLIVP